ncbi:MAG: flagellar hook-length control protein FliK, partial [Rhodobacteraceae bacterium]|nr:flagellar hook-length control protein FliK [Paracoccaceae bacterium]
MRLVEATIGAGSAPPSGREADPAGRSDAVPFLRVLAGLDGGIPPGETADPDRRLDPAEGLPGGGGTMPPAAGRRTGAIWPLLPPEAAIPSGAAEVTQSDAVRDSVSPDLLVAASGAEGVTAMPLDAEEAIRAPAEAPAVAAEGAARPPAPGTAAETPSGGQVLAAGEPWSPVPPPAGGPPTVGDGVGRSSDTAAQASGRPAAGAGADVAPARETGAQEGGRRAEDLARRERAATPDRAVPAVPAPGPAPSVIAPSPVTGLTGGEADAAPSGAVEPRRAAESSLTRPAADAGGPGRGPSEPRADAATAPPPAPLAPARATGAETDAPGKAAPSDPVATDDPSMPAPVSAPMAEPGPAPDGSRPTAQASTVPSVGGGPVGLTLESERSTAMPAGVPRAEPDTRTARDDGTGAEAESVAPASQSAATGSAPPAAPPTAGVEARPPATAVHSPPAIQGPEGLPPGTIGEEALLPAAEVQPPQRLGESGTASPAQPAQAETGRSVARQLVAAVLPDGEGGFEVRLSPEELGSVRLSLHVSEGAVTIAIQAERPETLELMRRHADILEREFRDAGFASLTFTFGQGSPDGRPPA